MFRHWLTLIKSPAVVSSTAGIFLFLLFVQLAAAQSLEIPHHTFGSLTADDKVERVNLNSVEITEMRNANVFNEEFYKDGKQYFHGRLVSTVFFNGNMYVADSSHQHIYRVHQDGSLEWVVGRSGRGPSEFLDIYHIEASEDFIFVHDRGQLKVVVFDKEFSQVGEFNTAFLGRTAVGSSLILTPSPFGSTDMFDVRKADFPFTHLGTFKENLIPRGMQPAAYRIPLVSGNKSADFATNINGTPYLFLFDNDLNHFKTIRLISNRIDETVSENPELVPVASADIQSGGVRSIFAQLILSDDGSLYVSDYYTLYRFNVSENTIRVEYAYHFFAPTELTDTVSDANSSPITIPGFVMNKAQNEICVLAMAYNSMFCYEYPHEK
ncbi:MAG: 6-bladed beta-propeller [Balneolales bacterium]|nr:6-bladed beta-propeller [Balneolales bacterium]